MPHSLRSKVKSLCYKGEITEKERDRLLEALEKQQYNCSDCILDGTDACSRGAGRAINDEICEDFLRGEEG